MKEEKLINVHFILYPGGLGGVFLEEVSRNRERDIVLGTWNI